MTSSCVAVRLSVKGGKSTEPGATDSGDTQPCATEGANNVAPNQIQKYLLHSSQYSNIKNVAVERIYNVGRALLEAVGETQIACLHTGANVEDQMMIIY